MPDYGSKSTAGYGTAASGELRGSVYDVFPDDAWVTSISARLGRTPSGGNPSTRLAFYTTSSNAPHTRLGQTAAFTVTTAMDHGAGGAVYTQPIAEGAVKVSAGGTFAIGIVGTGASLNHAMVPAASSPYSNRNLYYRSGVSGSPSNPFGATSSSYEGNISAWVSYVVNRAPTATANTPNTLISTGVTTFEGTFSDPDSSYGDKMLRYYVEVQRADGSPLTNSGWVTATTTQANSSKFSHQINIASGDFRWRCRVQDSFGLASEYSAWKTFTINTAPTAQTIVPSGLQTTSSVTFKGGFSDVNSGDSMLRFEYVIQTSTGGSVYSSGWVAATSTERANKEFSRARTLSPGSYRWCCRVQDSLSTPSGYSTWRSFNVHANRVPTATTVVPNGLQTSSTVNFQGTFSDPDESITNDKFHRFQIQILRTDVSPNTLVYNSGWLVPNSTEVANKRFNRNVVLSAGIPMAWRTQVMDNHGALSAFTTYRAFTINAGGYVENLGTFTGKQDTQTPNPLLATWRHANGLGCNMIRHQILQNGSPIKTGAYLEMSGVANGSINAAWSSAFGTYKLPWGLKNLSWRVQGRDTAGVWSDWSAPRSFHINSAPSVPTNLTPSNSSASSNRPLLRCKAVDDDGDSVTVKARIKNQSGTVLQTRTMSLVNGWYQYQTTSTDLSAYGTYSWDAYSYDGVLYSGEATTESLAQKSTSATFIYADVPNVVLTSPVENETYAGVVNLAWVTTPNEQAVRTTAYRSDGSVLYRRGWTPTIYNPMPISASAWGWRRGETYSIVHEIRDTNGLEGASEPVTFTIDYDLPSPIDLFIATPEMVGDDTYPTALNLTWNEYTEPDFQRYTVFRSPTDDAPAAVLKTITNPAETSITDLVPPTGVEVEYSIILTTLQGIDELESAPTTTSGQVNLESAILQNVYQPNQHIALEFDTARTYEFVDDVALEMPWGATAPLAIHSPANYQIFGGTFRIISDESKSAKDQIKALTNMYRSKQTICYRDERGRRLFGTITSFNVTDERAENYTVDLEITETMFEEGGSA